MKKTLLLCFVVFFSFKVFAQSSDNYGRTVTFSLKDFNLTAQKSPLVNGLVSRMAIKFPLPNGSLTNFMFDESLISQQKIINIQTYNATSEDGKVIMKLTIIGDKIEGIMHTPEGYFFIEPIDIKQNLYRIYSINDLPENARQMGCGYKDDEAVPTQKNGKMLSVAPFPVGTQLRKFTLAAAATGEMTGLYGSQANALAKIVSITNANNLIYELEASVSFVLATETTNNTIIFTNAATDPFGTIGANECQASFTTMNGSGVLPYTSYGIGHTFNTLPALGGNSFSANGVAGPTPCDDASKSRAFTQWTYDASIALIVGVFSHEVGHQFSAPHTYNAIGGLANNATFCINGWSATSAIEPGSGSTLMSYKNNCVNPTNYTLSGSNGLQYFNTKSIEFISNAVNGSSGTCKTSTATGNTPPVANAGAAITIPKGTPFTLNGSATDANGDAMTYTWEQYDVATDDDKGALGSSINGTGGYPAVNSTTAPLFRSEQSSSSTSRTFPKMAYITANANNPADNEGEDLAQVARTMKFRFTVRDNKIGGGGVDSDEILVTVGNSGPLQISAFNTVQTITASSSQTVTWAVNGTDALNANVKILLSSDGGNSFPYVLLASTPNDGSESITIPANIVNTTKGRIKVTCIINANAEFFDVNDADITITSDCQPVTTIICPITSVNEPSGSPNLNLGLTGTAITKIVGGSKSYNTAGASSFPVINNTDNTYTTCQVSSWPNTNAVVVKFMVSQTGNYSISSSGTAFNVFSIFNAETYNCSTFVGANSNGAISNNNPRSIALNSCTTYYALLYNINNANTSITFSVQGSGEVYEVNTLPSGYSYTYVALNTTAKTISAVSATSNFSTLVAGSYEIYGVMYKDGVVPANFVGQSTEAVISTNCVLFSETKRPVTVTGGNPCASLLNLVNPADNITTGTVIKQASATNGTITATNTISGTGTNVTYQAKNIQLNAGFAAASGSIFKAEVGGCN